MQMQEAAERGDLAGLRALIEQAKATSDESGALKLMSGNALFALGEFDAALQEHAAAEGTSVGDEARLEATIDLMALRRFAEACSRFDKVPSSLVDATSRLRILRADLNLRCGRADAALKEIKDLYRTGHSGAAEGLASVFGQQNVFRKYRTQLEAKRKEHPEDLETSRALGELFICGDYANTFEPTKTFGDAIRTLQELRDLRPDDCAAAGRLATARLLELVDKQRDHPSAADLDTIQRSLAKYLRPHPVCSEAVEAEFLESRLSRPDDHDARIALLRAGVERFPDRPVLAYLLVQEHDAKRDHKVQTTALERMVERSPDDWFPYARLSFETMSDNGVGAASLSWLAKGLARSPDSLVLNYLSAIFLLKEERYKEATEPAARLLAGQLETGNYHHDWDMGIAMLQSAIDDKSPPFSAWPTREEAAAQFQTAADLASLGPGLTTTHGCFPSGSGGVAILPLWYRPDAVRSAVAEVRQAP
jgi:tetratricopeptide (TPR) repeat protein